MNAETVEAIFGSKIQSGFLIVSDHVFVDVETFVAIFEGADGSFDSLMAVDGGTRGYASFFQRCKAEGIL